MTDENQKMVILPMQEEVNYRPLSGTDNQACANCRWFAGTTNTCHMIENYPADILPTGWCNRWEASPMLPDDAAPEPEVVVVDGDQDAGERSHAVRLNVEGDKPSFVKSLSERFQSLFGSKRDDTRSGFKVVGNHWLATWSNNFEDREDELFTQKAHDDYVARVDTGIINPPELWVWHTSKTRIGQAEWVARHGHFMIALGTFDDTPRAQRAKTFYERHADDTRLSHGFTYPTWAFDGKAYHQYNTFEITLLPRGVEANLYTSLEGVKDMAVNKDKRQHLERVFGKDEAARILSDLDERGKALEAVGVAFKDFSHAEDDRPAGDKQDAPPAPDDVAAVKALLPDLFEGQAEVAQALTTLTKEVQGLRGELAAVQRENEALRDELALSPPASRADSTVVQGEGVQQQITDKEKGEDGDDFWDFAKEKRGK